jgi:hypothetical protein
MMEMTEWRVDENGNFGHRDHEGGFQGHHSQKEKRCRGGEVKHEPQACPSGLLLGCSTRASDIFIKSVRSLPPFPFV